jgi:hypothetical protein
MTAHHRSLGSTQWEAVFENPDHDFPNRIIYRTPDADSLFARIEGKRNGRVSGVDFSLKRILDSR